MVVRVRIDLSVSRGDGGLSFHRRALQDDVTLSSDLGPLALRPNWKGGLSKLGEKQWHQRAASWAERSACHTRHRPQPGWRVTKCVACYQTLQDLIAASCVKIGFLVKLCAEPARKLRSRERL